MKEKLQEEMEALHDKYKEIFEITKEKENKNRGKNTLIIYAEFDTFTKRIDNIYFHVNDMAAIREWDKIQKARKESKIYVKGIILLRIGEIDTENLTDDIIVRGVKVKKVLEAEEWQELKDYETEENKI